MAPMPIHHYVHSTDRVVITTCFGDISFDHVLESLQALGVDPRFKPGFRQLVDLSQVSKLRLRLKHLEIQHSWYPFSNTASELSVCNPTADFFGLRKPTSRSWPGLSSGSFTP
jgi:hypothetical protein